jgi:nitrate/nitrite-specific signal transduction histidine kinase
MDFTNPAANKFAYKLEGVDKDWVIFEGRNFATYSHLSPGNYRFLVKAAISRGIWNDKPEILQFKILTPWYGTWWFYSLCAIAIATIIYLLFKYRLQQKLRVLQIRNRLHRDLHDDVGATLSSVKAYSELLGKNGNSEIISGLIKENAAEMIDRLEVISWATNPHYDNFKSLVNAMLKFARPITYSHGIELYFEKRGFEDEMMLPGDVRQNILLIFKEAINNMIKYAEADKCDISFVIKNQKLLLQVKDNGQGYDGRIKGGGAGLKNMHKRAEEMNGTMQMETAPGKGTLIRLTIPHPFKIPNTWYPKKSSG